MPYLSPSRLGLCAAALLLLIAAEAAEAESELGLQLDVAGGEEGSAACLLQREGRALAPARGPAVAPHAVEPEPHAGEVAAAGVTMAPPQPAAALTPTKDPALLAIESLLPKRQLSVSLASGVSDGMGIGGDRPPASLAQSQSSDAKGRHLTAPDKDKIVLLVMELLPPAWLLGVDRFYLGSFRTGVAKLLVSVMTLSVGGFVWGLIDFFVIVVNALKKEESLHALGMEAAFKPSMQQGAFFLAILDLLMLPVWVGIARYVWWVRKMARMERLKENAMKSPHFKAPGATSTTIRGG